MMSRCGDIRVHRHSDSRLGVGEGVVDAVGYAKLLKYPRVFARAFT